MMNSTITTARTIAQFFQLLHQKPLHNLPKPPDNLISSICHTLRNGANWETLTSLFTSIHLNEALAQTIILNLKHPSEAKKALLFFHWSSHHKLLQHPPKSYCLIVQTLVKANLFTEAKLLMQSAITRFPDPHNLIQETLFSTCSDPRVFDLLVQVLMKMRLLLRAFDCCCYLGDRGISLSLRSFNGLLVLSRALDQNHVAWKVYEEMLERRVYPNETSFEAMVSVMCKEGSLKKNLALLDVIHGERCAPVVLVNTTLLLRIFEENRTDRGMILLRRLMQKNLMLDDVMNSLIVFGYCRMGEFGSAIAAYEGMRSRGCGPNAFVYTCFIGNRCREGLVDEALELVEEMRALRLQLYEETYNCLIEGCAKAGRVKECLAFYNALENGGFAVSFAALRGLVEILCSIGEVERADEIITSVSERGVECDEGIYCSLIDGFGRVRRGERVMSLYHEMRHRGLDVGPRVYAALVDGLRRCGKVKDAEKFAGMLGGFVENIVPHQKTS